MICRSIVFVIAFSFLIVDIKPQGNVSSKIKEQLHVLSPFGSDNIQEEHRINAPIQTIEEMEHILGIISSTEMENHTASEEKIQNFFHNEEELLQKVESFLCSEDSEDYSKLDNEVAYGLLHVANLAFWISTNFRICTLLYSANSAYSDDQSLTDICNTRFNELLSAFNYFKEKINFFFDMATVYGQTYGNDIQVECVAKEVLTLSLDFVLDEEVLQTKQGPDRYVDGMIKWSSIDDVIIDGKAYKTIFPSLKKLFCNCGILEELSSSSSTNDDTEVCNCGALKEGSSSSSRNDDIGVYDDTNVASSSSNRPDDISFYNEKVKMSNEIIIDIINTKESDSVNDHRRGGKFVNVPTFIDMYNFLDDLIEYNVDYKRFSLIYDYFTIKIGKDNELRIVNFTTWLHGCIIKDVLPMWRSVARIEHENFAHPLKSVFRLIHHVRKLDKKIALLWAAD